VTENIDRLLPAVDVEPSEPPPSDPLLDDYETPDIVVAEDPPPPLGRSVAVDLTLADGWLFVRSGSGVIEVSGVDTLKVWATLCLNTERGASVALAGTDTNPTNFGMVGATSGLGLHISAPEHAGREERIRDALTRHPRVDDVIYDAEYDPDDVVVAERIVIVTDDELRVELVRR
jgi:hypothetical protein